MYIHYIIYQYPIIIVYYICLCNKDKQWVIVLNLIR